MHPIALFGLLGLALAAPAPGENHYLTHCTSKTGDSCVEWNAARTPPDVHKKLTEACKFGRSKFEMGGCPTEKRVGNCAYQEGAGAPGAKMSFYPPTTEAQAKQLCAAEKSVWTPR